MSVSTKHPELTAHRLQEWALCRHAYEGEGEIKYRRELYLPRPSGNTKDPEGEAAYHAYLNRAQFPEIMGPSVAAMVGIIHDKEIQIEMPDALNPLIENADGKGTTLTDFHKEISRQLLNPGRYGVLADAPEVGGDIYLAGYTAETVINWDRDFFALDECGDVRDPDGFEWTHVKQYRVLKLVEGAYVAEVHRDGASPEVITPNSQGGGKLTRVPFAIASAKKVGSEIHAPPLAGIARAAKAIYQLSADYRLQLFMSGQETWVSINCEAPEAIGAGVALSLQGTQDMPADAKYVSPSCSGIEAHLTAMEHNRDMAIQAGARLFEQTETQESGTARKMRFRSETANLRTIAQASCSLLEASLRNAAMLLGLSDEVQQQITVKPPKDLLDASMTPQDAVALWELVLNGVISDQTYYERIQDGGLADQDRSFDDEQVLVTSQQDRAEGLT